MDNLKLRSLACCLFAGLAGLTGCLPSAKFNVAVRVLDGETGKPIPDAWVFAAAYVQADPPFEAPYDKPLAGARVKTNGDGVAYLTKLEGLAYRGEPQDKLWKMLEEMKGEPRKRRIAGVEGGNLFVLAKGYGALSQVFAIKESPSYQAKLKKIGSDGRYEGLWAMGILSPSPTLELGYKELSAGLEVTLRMKKPQGPSYFTGSYCPETIGIIPYIATSEKTGTSQREKKVIYDYILKGIASDLGPKALESCGHGAPVEWFGDKLQKDFMTHEFSQNGEHDPTLELWITKQALALLPTGYEEVKRHIETINGGVVAEGADNRALNHFYNPFDPEAKLSSGEQALKWVGVGYPESSRNEWGWQSAQRYYREGDIGKAYKALGHVLAVLEDLSLPMNTHGIAHSQAINDKEGRFETYYLEQARKNFGNLAPKFNWPAKEPSRMTDAKALFDSEAKQSFGKIVHQPWEVNFDDYYGAGSMLNAPDDATLELMGEQVFPRTIENAAGLMQRFYSELHPALSVKAPTAAGTDAAPRTPAVEDSAKRDSQSVSDPNIGTPPSDLIGNKIAVDQNSVDVGPRPQILARGDSLRTRTLASIVAEARRGDAKTRAQVIVEIVSRSPATPEDVDALASLLRDGKKEEVGAVIGIVDKISPEATALRPHFRNLLSDKSEAVQIAGIIGAGRLLDTDAAPAILKLLKKYPRHQFRASGDPGATSADNLQYTYAAAKALIHLKHTDAIDELISRDEIMGMPGTAAFLGQYGSPVLPKLLPIAHHSGPRQSGAYIAIAYIRDERAAPRLVTLLDDNDPAIVASAASALADMPKSAANRRMVADALAKHLKNQDDHVRGYIYTGLAQSDSKESFDIIMSAVKTDDAARLKIFYALMNHPNPKAVPYLKEFIHQDEERNPAVTVQRQVAAQAIYRISGEKVPYKGVDRDIERYRQGITRDPYGAENQH